MKANISVKADLLKSLMLEDRQEVRGIRAMIYNLTSLLAVASFAITAFLIEKKPTVSPTTICILTDLLIIILAWGVFILLKRDLRVCRKCLCARQKLIMELDEAVEEKKDTNPFSKPEDVEVKEPDIKDTELKWLPILATFAILMKALVVVLFVQFQSK